MITKNQPDMTDKVCKILPVCTICKEVPDKGIRDGIIIKRAFICSSCERKIVNLTVDSIEYENIVNKIKAIIY